MMWISFRVLLLTKATSCYLKKKYFNYPILINSHNHLTSILMLLRSKFKGSVSECNHGDDVIYITEPTDADPP